MKTKSGFTLVELMLAIVIGSIVMMGAAAPLVGMIRQEIILRDISARQAHMDAIKSALRQSVRTANPINLMWKPDSNRLVLDSDAAGSDMDYIQLSGKSLSFIRGASSVILSDQVTLFTCERWDLQNKALRIRVELKEVGFGSQLKETVYIALRSIEEG